VLKSVKGIWGGKKALLGHTPLVAEQTQLNDGY